MWCAIYSVSSLLRRILPNLNVLQQIFKLIFENHVFCMYVENIFVLCRSVYLSPNYSTFSYGRPIFIYVVKASHLIILVLL